MVSQNVIRFIVVAIRQSCQEPIAPRERPWHKVAVMPPRHVVFVSGAPGAGKSTLAVPLAAELGFPLVSKDQIKETLHDALGSPPADMIWSQRLGAAAMELL